jgi:glycosyltransferase involved in cell wall biosynthesis
LPIIATKINGTEDFIIPDETGQFVRHDAVNIAAVLDKLLSNHSNLARMGSAARKRVETNYTWDRIADLTESIYFAHRDSRRLDC